MTAFLCFSFFPMAAYALETDILIMGIDNAPMPGAEIRSEGDVLQCTTNEQGACKIEHHDPLLNVMVSKPGYVTSQLTRRAVGNIPFYLHLETTDEQAKRLKVEFEERTRNEAIQKAERKKEVEKEIKTMDTHQLCVVAGHVIRGESLGDNRPLSEDHTEYVLKEAARRKLSFDRKLVKDEQIRLGITECQLYASWGLPTEQNRSVGPWGVNIQHVYRYTRQYVYTTNGRVKSWQD